MLKGAQEDPEHQAQQGKETGGQKVGNQTGSLAKVVPRTPPCPCRGPSRGRAAARIMGSGVSRACCYLEACPEGPSSPGIRIREELPWQKSCAPSSQATG